MFCYTVQQRIPIGMWECLCNRLGNPNYVPWRYLWWMDLNIKKKKTKEKKEKGRHDQIRNLRAYRKAPQRKCFPKGLLWDTYKSHNHIHLFRNFLSVCGLHLENNNSISLFLLPAVFYVFMKHVSVIYSVSPFWQLFPVEQIICVAPLGTLKKYTIVWFLCPSSVCLLSPLQSHNSDMEPEKAGPLNTYGLSLFLRNRNDWH